MRFTHKFNAHQLDQSSPGKGKGFFGFSVRKRYTNGPFPNNIPTRVAILPLLHRLFLLLVLVSILAACSITPDDEDETAGMTAEEIYAEAKEYLDTKDYESAAKFYERLESRYPYGFYAEQAQLDVIYAYYKDNEPESAIVAADRFIKLHPNHPRVDYAYYMRGVASYDSDQSLVNKIFKQNPDERDPKSGRRAFKYFTELATRFPNSKYTPDAIQQMYNIRNGLADYEIFVIDYYMQRKAYVAVVNRAKYVLKNYQGTPAIPHALGSMVKGYHNLGLDDLANDAWQVLKINFPKHELTRQLQDYLPPKPSSGA